MPYLQADLHPTDTTSDEWALAWCRFWLRDTQDDAEVYSDAELLATLEATAQDLPTTADAANQTKHYRPHQAAADLIEGDPDRKLRERLLSWQGDNRRPEAVARAILAAGAWVDAAIEAVEDVYPDRGGTLDPVF